MKKTRRKIKQISEWSIKWLRVREWVTARGLAVWVVRFEFIWPFKSTVTIRIRIETHKEENWQRNNKKYAKSVASLVNSFFFCFPLVFFFILLLCRHSLFRISCFDVFAMDFWSDSVPHSTISFLCSANTWAHIKEISSVCRCYSAMNILYPLFCLSSFVSYSHHFFFFSLTHSFARSLIHSLPHARMVTRRVCTCVLFFMSLASFLRLSFFFLCFVILLPLYSSERELIHCHFSWAIVIAVINSYSFSSLSRLVSHFFPPSSSSSLARRCAYAFIVLFLLLLLLFWCSPSIHM